MGTFEDDYQEGGTAQDEAWEGEGCRPASGNDANVACGLKQNARPDTKNLVGSRPSSKRVILLN